MGKDRFDKVKNTIEEFGQVNLYTIKPTTIEKL